MYQIHNCLSNLDNHSKKRFIHVVDVFVQSAAAYALALMVAAIVLVIFVTSRDASTLSLFAVMNYESIAILFFVSVCTFGVQILGKV